MILQVINARVSTCQWKGASCVFQQFRKNGLRPDGPSYGLAMEVMLNAGNYDIVHEFFGKMRRNGAALKALTYKVKAARETMNQMIEASKEISAQVEASPIQFQC